MKKSLFIAIVLLLAPCLHADAETFTKENITVTTSTDGVISWNIEGVDKDSDVRVVLPEMCVFLKSGVTGSYRLQEKTFLLWNAEDVNTSTIEFTVNGKLTTLHLAFRDIRTRGNQVIVNGTPVGVKTGDRMDVNPQAATDDSLEILTDDIRSLKLQGVTAVYSDSPLCNLRFRELCDRYGIYVLDKEVSSEPCTGFVCSPADIMNGQIRVFDNYYFRSGRKYALKWKVSAVDETLAEGIVRDPEVWARCSNTIDLGYRAEDLGWTECKNLYLDLSWVLKFEDGVLDVGTEISSQRLVICESPRAATAINVSPVKIVPQPTVCKSIDGKALRIRTFSIGAMDRSLKSLINTFLEISAHDGVRYRRSCYKWAARVQLGIDTTLPSEAYSLKTCGPRIEITGGSARGVWWGLQSLRQIACQCGRDHRVPALNIYDEPKYAIRGSHLDVCRHFFSVQDVKSWLDMMALHKLNTFHWHLTDNEGWRIEIKSLPALTQVGSVRRETIDGHYYTSHYYDGKPYGGFYTQDEIREIVAYAAARCIDIIPEIETPGHCVSALAAYPEMGCRGWGYETGRSTGSTPDVFCPGKDTTFALLEKVFDEVCDLFPSHYIHIGGDEVRKSNWAVCPHCQARMKAEGLSDLQQLQSWFISRVSGILAERGRTIIGWDEILEGGVDSNAVVMSWHESDGAAKAASLGNDVLMATSSYLYFDSSQFEDYSDVKHMCSYEYRSIHPLEKVFSYDCTAGLSSDEQKHILGMEGLLWTEFVCDISRAQLLVLPRMAALCERAWGSPMTTYKDFKVRTASGLLPLYRGNGYNYAEREFL